MSIKNRWFGLLLFLSVLVVTVALLATLNGRHRKAIAVSLDSTGPIIAFTFDDGPNKEYTPRVLDILYENNVPGTFFISGKNISGNEGLLKEMVQNGHELANHTYSHTDLTVLNREQILSEVNRTQSAVEKVIPNYLLNYVRPPYGRRNQLVQEAVGKPIVLWDIDSGDWEKPDPQAIADTVLCQIQDGDIIIFHDDNSATVLALKTIIPALKARGFQFATLSQLYEAKGMCK